MNETDQISLPPPFLDKMRSLLGNDEFRSFVETYDQPPRAGLRVNTLKISVADFSRLSPFPLVAAPGRDAAAFLVAGDERPGQHPYHDAGLYYLQEPSAMVAATILDAQPGELVLDLAAAPGGKSTHLAAHLSPRPDASRLSALRSTMEADGLLVANDVHAGRARILDENLARWGATHALVLQAEPDRLATAYGPLFDRVLVDAPCSGEGMFRRQPAIEWSDRMVAACSRRQSHLLESAARLVRPGGRLLYVTCTFSPEENEAVIAAFLGRRRDFELAEVDATPGFASGRPEWLEDDPGPGIAAQIERSVRLWPHKYPGEGHYMALLKRDECAGEAHQRPSAPSGFASTQPPGTDQLRLWRDFASEMLRVSLPEDRLHVHNNRLYLLPRRPLPVAGLRVRRVGSLLGELRGRYFRPAHDLAVAMTAGDAASMVDWLPGDERLRLYQAGAAVADPGPDGWQLVTVNGFGLGWAKRSQGLLKSHFPRPRRR